MWVSTPIGALKFEIDGGCIVRCRFQDATNTQCKTEDEEHLDPCFLPLASSINAQLSEYFSGKRKYFDLPLAPKGTPFQRDVWDALAEIPYGEKQSYSGIAAKVGRPCAARAVGNAIGANPLPIIIPCHRVLHAGGGIGGFSCGVWRKKWLLGLEKRS